MQNKGYYAVQGHSMSPMSVGTNRKLVCDFLLVKNTCTNILSRTVSKYEVITDYWLNFRHFAFLSPLWGLRGKVHCSSYAHWRARSGLPVRIK